MKLLIPKEIDEADLTAYLERRRLKPFKNNISYEQGPR